MSQLSTVRMQLHPPTHAQRGFVLSRPSVHVCHDGVNSDSPANNCRMRPAEFSAMNLAAVSRLGKRVKFSYAFLAAAEWASRLNVTGRDGNEQPNQLSHILKVLRNVECNLTHHDDPGHRFAIGASLHVGRVWSWAGIHRTIFIDQRRRRSP